MDAIIARETPADKNPKVSPASVKVTTRKSSLGTRAAILAALKDGPLSAADLAKACGVKAGSSVFASARRTLVKHGKIEVSGNTKSALWRLVNG
jgi:hypothetical protein